MPFASLVRHPASPTAPAIEIGAAASILETGAIAFRYRVRGDVRRIRLLATRAGACPDELWRHTCFEAFVKPKGSAGYVELNFAPSGAWAAYSFAGYRHAMELLATLEKPSIRWRADADSMTLDATVSLGPQHLDAEVGFSAVIEADDGSVSHWALAHPRAQPDFHDSAAWTGELERFGVGDRT